MRNISILRRRFEDILLNEKSKIEKSMYSMLSFIRREYICIYMYTHTDIFAYFLKSEV